MKQLCGFTHPDYPHYVCKLKKALYGLKHAPWAWFRPFRSFLLSHGLVCSVIEPYMFVLHIGSHMLILFSFCG